MPIKNAYLGRHRSADILHGLHARRCHRSEDAPLMFSFNGGPGSASVWLHLGALGPRRVKMLDDGMMPPPPYEMVDNDQTWLDQTDMVFIDPVGTGYSRATKPELASKFFGVNGDIESVGEFIRLYLGRKRTMVVTAIPCRRKLWHDEGRGSVESLFERGIGSEWNYSDLDRHEFPIHQVRRQQRPSARSYLAFLHGDRLVSQTPSARDAAQTAA